MTSTVGARLTVATRLTVVICMLLAACTGSGEQAADGDRPRSPTASIDASAADTETPQTTDSVTPSLAPTIGPPAPDVNTLIWAHDREPPNLHLLGEDNQLLITSWIWRGLLEGFFGVDSNLTYYPQLLVGQPEVSVADDGSMTILYELRQGLQWSDGMPLTMADAVFTYQMVVGEGAQLGGPVLEMADRSGWDRVTSVEEVSPTVLRVEFDSFVHDWRKLWTDVRVLPAHGFGEDPDADDVNAALLRWRQPGGKSLPSSGSLVFDRWIRGVELRLIRNVNYPGSRTPTVRNRGVTRVDGVIVRWLPDADALVTAVASGEADIILTKPDLDRADRLADANGVTSAAVPGALFEHLGLNLLNPHLARGEVREAIALAVDKSALADDIWSVLYGRADVVRPLGNTFWMPSQAPYIDHQIEFSGPQITAARALLAEAGYEADTDGIAVHPELGRLSLRFGTTGGDAIREAEQRLLAAQLERVGIEIVIDNVLGSSFFVERVFSGAALAASASGGSEGDGTLWDLAQFAWIGGPDPLEHAVHYTSGLSENPYGYANPAFDALADGCSATVDDVERRGCYNELDRFATQRSEENPDGLFVIPLGQRPNVMSYATGRVADVAIVADNPFGGVFDNLGDFRMR